MSSSPSLQNSRISLVTLVSIIPLFHCTLQKPCVCKLECVCACVNVCIIISYHILYYTLVLFWYYCMLLCIHKRWKFTVNTRTLYGVSLECFYIEDSMSTFAVVETFTFSACLLCICHSCLTFYNWKAIDWWLKVLDSV